MDNGRRLAARAAVAMAFLTSAVAAGPSLAATISIAESYKWNDGKNGNDVSDFGISQPIAAAGVPLTLDAFVQDDWDRTSAKGPEVSIYKIDFGVKAKIFGPFYLRPSLGYDINGGPHQSNDFSYYSVTGGVVIPLSRKVGFEIKVRYRDAFDGSNQFSTMNYSGGPSFAFTGRDVIRAFAMRESGFGSSSRRDYTDIGVGYAHTF